MEFLEKAVVLAIHEVQRERHGGRPGAHDAARLDAALAAPANAYAYGVDDVFALAATLAGGLVRQPAFAEANKRTAWVAMRVFLQLNGVDVRPAATEAVATLVNLAAGRLDERGFADWLAASAAALGNFTDLAGGRQ